MASKRVAVVTGSNKGIGFSIVRGLCKQFQGDVFLTARNEDLGKQAVAELNKEGLNPKFHQLDITNEQSVKCLHDFLKSNYGGLDVLVNNAGIAYKVPKRLNLRPQHTNKQSMIMAVYNNHDTTCKDIHICLCYQQSASTAPFSEQAEVTMKTNFFATLNVCEQLFPLLRPHARVVNVSSMGSLFALRKCSKTLQDKFTSKSITMDQLKTLMQQFVNDTKSGVHEANGWPNSAYGTTKIGVTVMTFIQQRENDRDDILINCCCPGYVDTDMSSHKGHKTIDEGADTPLYLALLPPNTTSPKGNYLSERKIAEWKA